ncbi:MAG: hypothetical protein ABF689_12190, partial [Gluconobacter cerinus]|uniref:hypothetical protein n=1 Tax=Gluconobacter cerinus TaxID=38307 RepID=UPI0039EBA5D2
AYTFNGHSFTPDEYPSSSKIYQLLENDGKTYVVVISQDNGSASSPQYRIFDVSGDLLLPSPLIGSGIDDHLKDKWSIINGDAVATIQKDDGTSGLTYHVREGKINLVSSVQDNPLVGPSKPPGGDYAALVVGMKLKDVFHLKAINPLLRKAFPRSVYEDMQKLAEEDFGSEFQAKNIGSIASLSQPHNSSHRYLALAIEANGTIGAIFSPGTGREQFFGPPNSLVKLELERSLH